MVIKCSNKNIYIKSIAFVFCFLIFFSFHYNFLFSKNYPEYITEVQNLQNFVHFGTSGWDGNWYVGSNSGWIVEFSSISQRDIYKRAFIGAKLGRAKYKDKENAKSVWEKEPINGEIYMGINSTSAWNSSNSFFLVNSKDVPKEGHPEMPLDGVGEARWFFVEIPLNLISTINNNYVAVWSTTSIFNSSSNSPILASAIGGNKSKYKTFMDNSINCSPPDGSTPGIKTLSFYETSLCIKLIPENNEIPRIEIVDLNKGQIDTDTIINASISGKDIYRTWLEIQNNLKSGYIKVSDYQYSPPFMFSLPMKYILKGKNNIRVAAQNIYENIGYSSVFVLESE